VVSGSTEWHCWYPECRCASARSMSSDGKICKRNIPVYHSFEASEAAVEEVPL
jgi:hypothetical protein